MQLTEKKLTKRRFDGLDIRIEVEKGQFRSGTDSKGVKWKSKMHAHYGYILRTNSPDGEHLDCYLRATPKSNAPVFVVHLLRRNSDKYDEDKVFLGFSSEKEVKDMFKLHYPMTMWGGCTEFTMEIFKIISYSSSKSKTMITNQVTYDKFKKAGRLPAGIRSPIGTALKVSESRYFITGKGEQSSAFENTFSTLAEAKYFYEGLIGKHAFEIIREGTTLSGRILTEGLRKGDLNNIIMPMISVDEYVAKDDSDNIVMAIFVRNEPTAVEPLMLFFEMHPGVELVDAGDSASILNTSVVYIEFKRELESREAFEDVIADILMIAGLSLDEVTVSIPNSDKKFRLNSNFVEVYFNKAVQ